MEVRKQLNYLWNKINTGYSFSLILVFYYLPCQSQQTFEKIFAGGGQAFGSSVIQVADSEYAVLWCSNSITLFGHNFFQLRINNYGDSLWQKSYCGVLSKRIMLMPDSNVVACATSYCTGNSNDILLQKMNYQGDTLWSNIYGYANPDFVHGMDTIKDGFVLLSDNSGSFPTFFKTDTLGNFISSSYGYAYMQFGYAIKGTLDGGYIVAGWYGNIPNCWAIEKFDSTGAFQWGNNLGYDPNSDIDDRFRDVIQLPDSDYIVCGTWPMTLARINHVNGDTVWTRTVSYNLWANSLSYTPDGNIIIAGDNKIIKYDLAGNQLWLRSFPDADLYSISPTSDGGYIATGRYPNTSIIGSVLVIKTDSLGNVSSLLGMNEYNLFQNNSNIFPNPITNISQLNFSNPKNELYHFSVADITGRISEKKEVRGNTIEIEKGNKSKGVYFYSLINIITGEIVNGKFVVQ